MVWPDAGDRVIMIKATIPTNSSTTFLTLQNRFDQLQWYIAVTGGILQFLMITWMFICVLAYGIKTGKWSKEISSKKYNSGIVYTTALLCMLISYTRIIPEQLVFNMGYGHRDHMACQVATTLSVLGYSSSLATVYLFLWLKQRALYLHPSIKNLFKERWIHYLSWLSITFVLTAGTVSVSIFVSGDNYSSSGSGCHSKPSSYDIRWTYFVMLAIVFSGQGLICFLFVYPIRKMPLHEQSCSLQRVKSLFARSAIVTVACVTSYILANVTSTVIVPVGSTVHIEFLVYDCNLMFNLLSVLLSFERWKTILASPFKPAQTLKRSWSSTRRGQSASARSSSLSSRKRMMSVASRNFEEHLYNETSILNET